MMHSPRRFPVFCVVALLAPLEMPFLRVQEATPPSASGSATETPTAAPAKPSTKKYRHVHDFLIRGTVFNEKALAFPGAQLRIRREGEKKFRWESLTNSRGEFAVRVPPGSNYEMVVRAKGFLEQTRTVEAKTGGDEENMVLRMQPAAGVKK